MRTFALLCTPAAGITLAKHSDNAVKKIQMDPQTVSDLLSQVKDYWTDLVLEGKDGKSKMEESCDGVIHSVIDGSSGDAGRVDEYFSEICKPHDAWCGELHSSVMNLMRYDEQGNRDGLNVKKFCTTMFDTTVHKYAQEKLAKREAAKLEKAKKEAEAAKAKAAAEAKSKKELAQQKKTLEEVAKTTRENFEKIKKAKANRLAKKSTFGAEQKRRNAHAAKMEELEKSKLGHLAAAAKSIEAVHKQKTLEQQKLNAMQKMVAAVKGPKNASQFLKKIQKKEKGVQSASREIAKEVRKEMAAKKKA